MSGEDATVLLDRWKDAHKSRDVTITHDDGYGGSAGWEVTLRGADDKEIGLGVCRQVAVGGYSEQDGWLSLDATIRLALEKWGTT